MGAETKKTVGVASSKQRTSAVTKVQVMQLQACGIVPLTDYVTMPTPSAHASSWLHPQRSYLSALTWFNQSLNYIKIGVAARGISSSKLPLTSVSGSIFGIYTSSLVPRPRPAFRRLQYGKAGQPKAASGPGNEAIYLLTTYTNVA